MNKFENNVLKIILGGIALFAVGLFVGYQLNNHSITSLQGFLFNAAGYATDGNATNSNATDSNATDSNATDANATSSNATNSNATDANASATNNIIYLEKFTLKSTTAKKGDKIYLELLTNGACNSGASIVFKSETGLTFTTSVESITENPYIVIPTNVTTATYTVTDVLLVGKNNDNTTFTKQYSLSGNNVFDFNASLTIQSDEKKEEKDPGEATTVSLNSISLETNKANVADKVFVNIDTNMDLNSLKLTFLASNNKKFNVYVQSLNDKPYFEIPTTVESGTYILTGVTLVSKTSTAIYSLNGELGATKFSFNTTLEIVNETENTYIYNNEDINSMIITKLYNATSGTNITINADSNTLINSEVFNAIKGQDKTLTINYQDNQIIFKGETITSSKTIDIGMLVDNVNNNQTINKLVSKGVVVNFPDNGNLPGEALIRIKATKNIKTELNDTINVYFFNEADNNFFEIQTDIKKTSDGYYEFTINHNSNYLLVNEKLDSSLVTDSSSTNVVSFQKSSKIYLLLIGIGVIVLVLAVVIIVIVKKRKKDINS